MPIIFGYLLKLFMTGFLRVMGIFVGLFILLDSAETIRKFSDQPGFNWPDAALLLLMRLPEFLVQIMPSLGLMATLVVLVGLIRHNELTAMHTSGISIYRVMIPFMLGGVVIALGHLIADDRILPQTNSAAQVLEAKLNADVEDEKPAANQELWLRWKRQIINARQVFSFNMVMLDVTVLKFDAERNLISRIEAKKAEFKAGKWQLVEGVEYLFAAETTVIPFAVRPWGVKLTAQQLDRTTPRSTFLTLKELWELSRRLRKEGYDPTAYEMILHRKLADPITTLTAILLAFPFSLRVHQRLGGSGRTIFAGLLAGFSLFVVMDLSTALGLGGRLPPLLAAWAPAIFFAGIGGFLMMHLEEINPTTEDKTAVGQT